MLKKILDIIKTTNTKKEIKYLFAFIIIESFFTICSFYFLSKIVEMFVSNASNLIINYTLLYIIFSILREVIAYVFSIKKKKLVEGAIYTLQNFAVSKILYGKSKSIMQFEQGDILSRINNDIQRTGMVIDLFLDCIRSIIFIAITSILLLYINIFLFIAYILLLPIFFYIQKIISRKSSALILPWKNQIGKINGLSKDLLSNHITIKVFTAHKNVMKILLDKLDEQTRLGTHGIGKMYFFSLFLLIPTYFPVLLVGAVGTYLTLNGIIKMNLLTYALLLTNDTIEHLFKLQNSQQNLPQLLTSYKRVEEILNINSEDLIVNKTIVNEKEKFCLKFSNVNLSYDNVIVLDNLSFQIKVGEKVALIGASGSGKSSILKLIVGIEEQDNGSLSIFGSEIRTMDITKVRDLIRFVNQDMMLFDGTVYQNLVYSNPKITKSEANKLLIDVGLEKELSLEQEIGNGGSFLSGGQRQRLAIAMAISKEVKLLLLDEITSALDKENEIRIMDVIENIATTQLMITHKISMTKSFDRILVLKNGKIVESGTYIELIKGNGYFKELYDKDKNQKENYNEEIT